MTNDMFCPLVSIRVMNSGQLPLKGRSLSRHYNDDRKNWDPSTFRKDSKDFSRRVNFDAKNNANQEFCQLEKVLLVRSNISSETIELRLSLDYNAEERKAHEVGKIENKNGELKERISEKVGNVMDEKKIDLKEKTKNGKEKCENLENLANQKIAEKIRENSYNQETVNYLEENFPARKNIEEENKKLKKREYKNFPALSSLTQKKMDDLLKSLRERTKALSEHELKANGQFAGGARSPQQFHWEIGTQEKSGSLANYAIAIGPEARASFAERIQEIWVDHKSHWSIVGEKKPKIFSEIPSTSRRVWGKIVEEEKIDRDELEINNYEPENSAKMETTKKSKFTSTDQNFQTFQPIICHVGVQYELEEFKDREKFSDRHLGWGKKSERSIEMKIDEFPDFFKSITPEKEEKKTTTFSDAKRTGDCGKSWSEQNENFISSFFSEESLESKKIFQKFSRKKLNIVLPKIRLKSRPNLHFQIPRVLLENRDKNKGFLSRKNWFSIGREERSRMREKLSKLLPKNRTKGLRNLEKLARGLKNIFSWRKKKSDLKMSTGPSRIQKNEDKSSWERLSGSGGCEKPMDQESPSQIEKIEEILSSKHSPRSGGCESSIEREKSFPQLEYPKKIDLATKSHESMTNLSVTTSNSAHITLQLLGSTSDTKNVPSGESRLGLAPRLVESCSDTLKSNPPAKLDENSKDLNISPRKNENPKLCPKFSNIFEENENPSTPKIDKTTKATKNHVREVEKLPAKKTIDPSRAKISDLRSKRESEMKNKAMVKKDRPTGTRPETLAKRVISKTSSSSTEKNLRLQRRKSVIDIKVDKLSSEQTKKVDVPNGEAQRSRCSSSLSNSGKKMDLQKCRKVGMASSSMERPRQRKDSPMVPRKGIRTLGPRGKSSLIPIAVRYKNLEKNKSSGDSKDRVEPIISLNFSPPSLENIADVLSTPRTKKKGNAIGKPKKIEPENFFLSPRSSESRKILKNTLPNSPNLKSKKNEHENRVHFEADEDFLGKEKSLGIIEKKKMDDVKIEKRIKSSLETGEPLKRITITDPHVVPKKIERVSSILEKTNFLVPPEETSSLRKEKTASKSFNRVDKKKWTLRAYRHESPSTRKNPRQTKEKCDSNKIALSYRSFEEKHRHRSNRKSEELRSFENLSKIDTFEKSERSMLVDLTSIKEKLDNDIIERTSRTSGTEDNDCAIILIKAINSSMQFSDD